MTKIIHHTGNIFELMWQIKNPESLALITHVCNDIGGWGSGFVKSVSEYYPCNIKDSDNIEFSPEHAYRKWSQGNDIQPFKLGEVQFCTAGWKRGMNITDVNDYCEFANMIAQHQTIKTVKKPIRYSALIKCMHTVRKQIKKMEMPVEIHAPMFGSALAGGTWDFIEELIVEIWTSHHVPVHIYKYK